MNARANVPQVPGNYQQVQPAVRPSLGLIYAGAGLGAAGQAASRAASRVMPLVGKSPVGKYLPTWASSPGHRLSGALELPRVAHVVEGLVAREQWHREFCRVVHATPQPVEPGSGVDQVFSGALHVMAFPTIMSVITRTDFPLPAMGMVHLDNHVQHLEPVAVGEELTVTSWAEELRSHRAGTAVTVYATLMRQDGTVVWAGRSTFLAKGVHTAIAGEPPRDTASGSHRDRPSFHAPQQTAQWRLAAGTGREYAKVSGDYNPIHLTDATAKALGMKGAIAHGMYTASRALAATGVPAGPAFEWSVEFAAPVVLPASVAVSVTDTGRREDWTGSKAVVWDPVKGRPHMDLSAQPLTGPRS